MKKKVLIGRVGKPVGRDGKHRVFFFADPGNAVLSAEFPEIFYSRDIYGSDMKPAAMTELRRSAGKIFASFSEDDIAGKFLFAEKWRLKEGFFWIEELVGCEVKDVFGNSVGKVTGVEADLPQVWLSLGDGLRNFAIPFVREVVKEVIIEKKIIRAKIPEGIMSVRL